jgi:S-adenosylmethionine uptake transporter
MRHMPAAVLMILASLLFSTMGVCVKLAAAQYTTGEIVFYRGLIGALFIAGLTRWRGRSLRTPVPGMHLARSVSGVAALCLWFYTIGQLPLATAVTLNYMSSVWMATFLVLGALLAAPLARWLGRPVGAAASLDALRVVTVLVGFAGVALVLKPTLAHDQWAAGLVGLASGMLSAAAYMQVTALGRAGEPEYRVVFYFSLGGMVVGAASMLWTGPSHHTLRGLLLLAATGLLATLAQMAMTRAYAVGRLLGNASLQYLGIVFSFIYGVWLFHDPVTWLALAGMAMIIGAGLVATLRRPPAAASLAAPLTLPPAEALPR